jgi:AGCS family alanine or glycine:cation symporter|tara:strand:+ start:2551 stop:4137 length:1587 start_codon:yes stop_codon:yes gene_type:complete
MDRKQSGLIFFSIIAFFLYAFGVELFENVWSFPEIRKIPLMVIALVGTGIYATVRLGFPQIKYLKHGINVTSGKYDNPKDKGDLSHFQALTTALSATVGVGNIAGVATAIYYGGPGALFWMWITAFFGTTLKYAECTLSVKYREMNSQGYTAGGPMYTIENGMGKKWSWMAIAFAGFAIICSFATGNAIQSFTVSDQIYSESIQIFGSDHFLTIKRSFLDLFEFSFQQVINGIILSSVVGLVIIGGIKRIGRVTGYLAPIMAVIYFISSVLILTYHYDEIFGAFSLIFNGVFNPTATVVGAGGGALLTMINTMLMGVKRGLYSNEAGQGSAAIAHSTAKTKYPVREGAVAMLGPYIDTIIICTLTGLVIICTGAWKHTEYYASITASTLDEYNNAISVGSFRGLDLINGSLLTSFAFKNGLQWLFNYGDKIITLSVLLFATSTAISWSFYGDRSTEYLFGEKAIFWYRVVYIIFVFIGANAGIEAVWAFGDAALGFMTFPNLISIIFLTGTLKKMTKKYFNKDYESIS